MKILLVEDDRLTAAAMMDSFIEQATVDLAEDVASGLKMGLGGNYDVMIVDRGLPDGDGLSVIQALRENGKATPALILSGQTNSEERVAGLRGGADVYLNKPCDFPEILAQVHALARRSGFASAGTRLQVEDLTMDLMTHAVVRGGMPVALLPREFQLLRELMRNAGEVVPRSAFWEKIWGYRFDPGTGVLEVHIARLRSKIDRGFDKPLIHTVRGVGYRLGGPRKDQAN